MSSSVFNKEIARTITHSWGRFIAIFLIVALGVGFYSGLRMTAPDMRLAADGFYDYTNLMDIRVVSTLGMSAEDIDALRDIEGVEQVQAAYETDVVAQINDEPYVVRVHSLPYGDSDIAGNASSGDDAEAAVDTDKNDIPDSESVVYPDSESVVYMDTDPIGSGYVNELIVEEGRLPENPGECVMSADRIMATPLSIGDTVQITEGSADLDDTMDIESFIVVGLVHSSYYASSTSMGSTTLGSGLVEQFMYVMESDFDSEFPITEAYITVKGARDINSSSQEYDDLIAVVMSRIEEIADDRAAARTESLKSEALDKIDESRAELEDKRAEVYGELADARAKLDDAESEIDSGAAELDDARKQLADGEAQLAEGEVQLADGERRYAEGVSKLADERRNASASFAEAQKQIQESKAELSAASEELAASKAQLDAQWAQLASQGITPDNIGQTITGMKQMLAMLPAGSAQYGQLAAQIAGLEALVAGQQQYDSGVAAYEQGMYQIAAAEQELEKQRSAAEAQFDAAQAQLDSSRTQLDASRAQLDASYEQIDSSRTLIAEGEAQLEEGRQEYEDGLAEYESGKAEADAEFADAEQEIADAEAKVADIADAEWLVMDRAKLYGAESFDMDAGRVDNIAQVFPFIFFLVAALVALTTMTRMVDEERMQIGTFKALGYSRARITSKYLIYAGIASLAGSIVGILALSFALPAFIMTAYSIMYIIPIGGLAIDVPIALTAILLGVGVTLAATAGAAVATLRESPAALMLPPTPKAGKKILLEHIGPLWRNMSFLWKVTARNILRYKKRLFMTVVGIAGCTALLLTGFGLSNSINDIIDRHYGEIIQYNVIVMKEDDFGDDDAALLEAALDEYGEVEAEAELLDEPMVAVGGAENADAQDIGRVTDSAAVADDEAGVLSVQLMVPENLEDLSGIWDFRDRVTQDAVGLDDFGAVITEKLASKYGVEAGDTLYLAVQDDMGNATNEVYAIPVSGVIENYIGHRVFMTDVLYEEIFDEDPVYNSVYLKSNAYEGEGRDELIDAVRGIDGVKTVAFNDETINQYKTALQSVDMVVVILILAAALLAFIVLYNLTNINITERMREIATLKVLGFTAGEIDTYIFREIVILSIVGSLIGLALGIFLENFVVTTAEVDAVMFGRDIHPSSYLISFVLTMLFTVIVALTMRFKLRRIDMVESLKSNE